MINIIQEPNKYHLDENIHWIVYNSTTSFIVMGPHICTGYCFSPHTLVTGDTKEELDQYIIDNNLVS